MNSVNINKICTEKMSSCEDNALKKVVKKKLKSGALIRKERKKAKKTHEKKNNDEIKTSDKSQNVEKPTISRKRKLQTDSMENPIKKKIADRNSLFTWTDEEYLAKSEGISIATSRNIIELFDKENTIPFIARYRCHLTDNLQPDKLRKIKTTYEYIQSVHKKAEQLIKSISSNKALTPDLYTQIQTVQTLEELDLIGSQVKKDSKKSLAERARQLGLEPAAKSLLEGNGVVCIEPLVNPKVSGLESFGKISLGIQHIIADVISKNVEVHALLQEIYSSKEVLIISKFKRNTTEDDKSKSKYHLYGDFSQPLRTIKPHQTLAINRGESENELSVKIFVPDFLWLPLKSFCHKKWLKSGDNYELRRRLFSDSVNDAIKRLLGPLVVRRIRAKLNAEAENEALFVFGCNLRQLLMTPPCNGHIIMGIDPGFQHGCKVAIISQTGSLISHDKFFLQQKLDAKKKLKSLILSHGCEIIALGNGKGCRETEAFLSDCIKKRVFKPLNVSYTIITEQGVSIYSCSPVAAEEFPNLNPQIVSALSLARRLQNPLSELVKVEPKHLGVGMYQHDIGEKRLVDTLDDVVSECVSFVGVDINSASFHLLKRVAGLSTSKAQEIIKYRTENCSFKRREDLKKVKGIKIKTFQQCAGFIRIIPSTARCTKHCSCKDDFNPLDETSIHPESYEAAIKIINRLGLKLDELGSENFVETVEKWKDSIAIEELAKFCECSVLSVQFIIETLMKPKNFDLRTLTSATLFRKEVKKLEDLNTGQILEGVVRNVVSFGAFVDIGVGQNGLIHVSQMGMNILNLNDRVQVEVKSVIHSTQRIELKLLSIVK